MARLELKLPPLLLVLILAVGMWGLARVTTTFDVAVWPRMGFAALLLANGAWMTLAGLHQFRRANTTVNPMAPDESSVVVDAGIYRHTRNPMYLGMSCVLVAWAVWLASPWALLGPAVFVAWMTRFQILPEERALAERFGDAYRDYCRRVRRWA